MSLRLVYDKNDASSTRDDADCEATSTSLHRFSTTTLHLV